MTVLGTADGGRVLPAPLLVGRTRECAELREHLAGALSGHGGVVLIGGEAGIGKTALAEVLAAEATTHGAIVLVGHCYDLIETPPYGPWTEVLDRWPPLPDQSPPLPLLGVTGPDGLPEPRAARFVRVRDFLLTASAVRPIVLVIEDAHWADPASLDLLRFLARELAGSALLLVVTYRAEEMHRRHPLYALLPVLVRESRAVRLNLRPLGDDDLRALVRSRYALSAWDEARLVAYLHGRADGNPFYVGELLRALNEEGILRPGAAGTGEVWRLGDLSAVRVPAFLRQVIDGRLARLGDDAYRLLGLAATIGQETPLALWRAVADSPEDVLADVVERAVAAHLLVETASDLGLRFAHALIRETLYEGIPLPRRQSWHRRIGEALLASPPPDPDAVASHFRLADDARAADWLVLAGERAQRAYAWVTAADRFAAALALLDARDTGNAEVARRGWLRLRIGHLLRYTDPARAVTELSEARRLSVDAGDALLVAAATFYSGQVRCWAGEQFSGGIAQMAEGVAALDALSTTDCDRFARMLADGTTGVLSESSLPRATLSAWRAQTGRYAEAEPVAQAILDAMAHDDPSRTSHSAAVHDAYLALGLVHAALGRPAEARGLWSRSQTALRAIGHHVMLHQHLFWDLYDCVLPYQADRLDERARLSSELAAARRSAHGIWLEDEEPGCLALWLLEGRWADLRAVVANPESFQRLVEEQKPAVATLGRVQGDVTLAWRVVREELPPEPELSPEMARSFNPGLELIRLAAALTLDAGDPNEARRWLEAHDRWLAWSGAVRGQADGHLAWAAFHRAAGDAEAARLRAEQSLAGASSPRQPLALLAAHRFLGELATETGRYVEAKSHLTQALALAGACAVPYERALTLLGWALLHTATGADETARPPLTEARAIFAELGARPALARADALASGLATPTAVAARSRPDLAGLTAREIEVLRLVARGSSNAAVAAQLFLSPRTINTHLTAIYGKLGVASRGAAIRFALDHDLR